MLQLPDLTEVLKDANVSRRQAGKCSCGGQILVYSMPVRLDKEILPLLSSFDKPAFDFNASHLLKIENPLYIITGVKRLKEIRFTAKNEQGANLINDFEAQLAKYVKSKEKK